MIPTTPREQRFWEKGYRAGIRNAGTERLCPVTNDEDRKWWMAGQMEAQRCLTQNATVQLSRDNPRMGIPCNLPYGYFHKGWRWKFGGWQRS